MNRPSGVLFIVFLFSFFLSNAQQDPEFPKGFYMQLRLHNGMVTNFHSSPDLYIAGLQLIPQVTVIPSRLRAGIVAGGFFTANRIHGIAGPSVSLKLKSFQAGAFGTAGNLHLSIEQLWGTDKQRLFGGGLHVDLLNKLTLGLTAHRDYSLNTWWIQTAIAIRISKKKTEAEIFNQ